MVLNLGGLSHYLENMSDHCVIACFSSTKYSTGYVLMLTNVVDAVIINELKANNANG